MVAVDLAVEAKVQDWSLILDIRLALSPPGLLLALRLAQTSRVWLIRTLWQILQNSREFLGEPGALGFDPIAPDTGLYNEVWVAALTQWQKARQSSDLAGLGLYWTGDALAESLLPADVDPRIVQRFERLASAIEARLPTLEAQRWRGHPLQDSCRDAVALAAALGQYQPLILSRDGGTRREEPAICDYLQRCGVPCQQLISDHQTGPLRDALNSLITRSNALPLTWTGLRLAAIHVVAPEAVFLDQQDEATSRLEHPWRDASVFWYFL